MPAKYAKRRERRTSCLPFTSFRVFRGQSFLESVAETNFTGDSDLIGRHASFEEVREFLNILQIHKPERIFCTVNFLQAKHCESLVGDELEILTHVDDGKS